MTSSEDVTVDTVLEIFHEMSVPSEPVNFDFIKKFLNEFMPNGKISKGLKKFVMVKCKNITPPPLDTDRILASLEKAKNDLKSTLVFLKFTWNNANLIVETLIESIKAYQVEFRLSPCSFISSLEGVKIIGQDLIQDVQIIARCLFENICVVIAPSCDDLLPFYFVLAELLEGFIYFAGDDVNAIGDTIKLHPNKVRKGFENSCCPFVITEDADIHSAVDSICKSICQAQVMVSVSHIFIEECVYDRTLLLLKDRVKRIHHGSRYDKRTELEFIDDHLKDDTSAQLKLEIFCANEKSPFKLCINWNPKDIDQADRFSKSFGFIPVLPFRNLADLKLLIKENCPPECSASVWSENLAITNMESEFEFSPLWINNYGILNYLSAPCVPRIVSEFPYPGCTGCSPGLTACFKEAKNGYLIWQKCVLQHLEVLHEFFQASHLNSNGELLGCRKCLSKSLGSKIQSLIESKISLITKSQLKCSHKPIGIVMIRCENATPLSLKCLHKLIASSLVNGNSVIVFAKDEKVQQKMEEIKMPKSLPKGVLSFISTPNVCLDSQCLFQTSLYDFPLAFFHIGEDMEKGCFNYASNNYSSTYLCLKKDVIFCDNSLLNLTSCTKLFSISE